MGGRPNKVIWRVTRVAPAAVLATALAAQGEPTTAGEQEFERPTFHLLRQDEDWSGLAGVDRERTGDWFDRIKYVPLNEDGSIWASFGGQARARLEVWDDFNFGATGTRADHDTYLLTRVMAHGDVHIGEHLRVFGEFKSSHSTDRDLPGGRRFLDSDSAALQQAFVDIEVPVLEDWGKLTVRPGRQMLLFGAQRLVSPRPWANTMRTWEGVLATLEIPGVTITGFWTEFVPVEKYEFNDADDGIDFYGGHATTELPGTELGWDLYVYGLSTDTSVFNGTTGEQDRYTIGSRVWGDLGGGFDVDVEGAWQVGTVSRSDINAQMVSVAAGYRLGDLAGGSRLFVGFDWASGDKSRGGNVQTFDPLFPRAHYYLGYVDTIGRQNIFDVSGGFRCQPLDGLEAQVTYHSFWLDSTNDALYNASGVPIRLASSIDSHYVGGELDLVALWRWGGHVAVLTGYSHFFAGDAIEDSGQSQDIDFAYTELQFTF